MLNLQELISPPCLLAGRLSCTLEEGPYVLRRQASWEDCFYGYGKTWSLGSGLNSYVDSWCLQGSEGSSLSLNYPRFLAEDTLAFHRINWSSSFEWKPTPCPTCLPRKRAGLRNEPIQPNLISYCIAPLLYAREVHRGSQLFFQT